MKISKEREEDFERMYNGYVMKNHRKTVLEIYQKEKARRRDYIVKYFGK